MKLAIGADHAGYDSKQDLIRYLTSEGYDVIDMGASDCEPSDYPDFAVKVSKAVQSGRVDRGILTCGSGLGMAIAANKFKGIRAAATWSDEIASLAAEHNWCNVLCVPARFMSFANARKMVSAYLNTPFDKGGRHERRVKKIEKIKI